MKKDVMVAITFAENGEWDIARTYIPMTKTSRFIVFLRKMFTAITFAEYGMVEDARYHMKDSSISKQDFLELLGLDKCRCNFYRAQLVPSEIE